MFESFAAYVFTHGVTTISFLAGGALATIVSLVHFEAVHREARGWFIPAVLNLVVAVPIYNVCRSINRRMHPVRIVRPPLHTPLNATMEMARVID
jgi:hypothetical protein